MHTIRTIKTSPCCAIIWLAAFLMMPVLGSGPSAQAQDAVPSGAWLTFRGNPAHTGVISLEGPPEEVEMKVRWRINSETDPISASPAVTEDGTVYIGTEGGFVAAIQPEGGPGWIFKVEGPVLSSPSVDETGNVFVVTGDGYMYYISTTGELIWKSNFDTHTSSSPVISGGTAYLGIDDDALLGITLEPAAKAISEEKRVLSADVKKLVFLTNGSVKSSPAFSGNTVFFGGGEYLYALNPSAGGSDEGSGGGQEGGTTTTSPIKWRYRVNGDILSSPAVSGSKVYVGSDDGCLYAFSENVSGTENILSELLHSKKNDVRWSDLQSDTTNSIPKGKLLWKKQTGGKVRSSPAVATPVSSTTPGVGVTAGDTTKEAQIVYVGSDDGNLYAFDENGEFKWKFPTGAPVRSSPAVDKNGDIYFGSDDGSVYALFPDGALKWSFQTYSAVRSSPAIGPEKRLYVGSDDGYLYCLGESDEENRKPDIQIDITNSLTSIENEGNPATITADITSKSEDPNILSRIASVTIDLLPMNLVGIDPLTGDVVTITQATMLDDGENEDDVARDGTYTYAFGITTDTASIDYQDGIFTHLLADGIVPVGPVPIMITVEDIYGHRISKPFPLNVLNKIRGSLAPDAAIDQPLVINNRLNNQTLTISFTSGTPTILSITPNQGAPGQRVPIAIEGLNTNFTKNKTRVEIFNETGFRIAQAIPVPGTNEVLVLSDTALTAILTISDPNQVTSGSLIGLWDVVVTTQFSTADCGLPGSSCEIVIKKNAFAISGSTTTSTPTPVPSVGASAGRLKNNAVQTAGSIGALQADCIFTLDIANPAGIRPNDSPWLFNSGYEREIVIERADSGDWNCAISLGPCTTNQSFKLIAKGSNNGYLTGEVRNGFTSEGVDGVTISALTGEGLAATSNATQSSGGGYYMLPLSATKDKYTVIASKDGLVDIENDVVITEDEETLLNFSLKPDINSQCPIATLLKEGNLKQFYEVRDRLLLKNEHGRHWVVLYYRHAPEVTTILLKSPALKAKAGVFIMKVAQEALKVMKGGKADSRMKSMLEELINSLIQKGSPELKKSLKSEKQNILNFIRGK